LTNDLVVYTALLQPTVLSSPQAVAFVRRPFGALSILNPHRPGLQYTTLRLSLHRIFAIYISIYFYLFISLLITSTA